VVALQRLALGLTGERQSELVTVLSTLALAALAAPLRSRIQNTIDRRFFRRKYDTAMALAQFNSALRADPHADLPRLCQDLTEVVQDALSPASVSLWLRPAKGSAPYGAQPPQSSRDGPSAKS